VGLGSRPSHAIAPGLEPGGAVPGRPGAVSLAKPGLGAVAGAAGRLPIAAGHRPLHWLLAGAGLALLVFAPQLLAWKILFDHALTIPQGPGYVDWGAPHLSDVLISANHGLFTWTPAMALGLLGLFLGWRREPWLQGTALAIFAATAWVNGSVTDWDWAAGDAFGARRFDLVVPLLALGLARLLSWLAGLLRRQPLLAPAAALGSWSSGTSASSRRFGRDATRMRRRSTRWRRTGAKAATGAGGRLWLRGGPPGRALVYRVFSAEYLYTRFNRNGTFTLADADDRWLGSGWAPFAGWRDDISFRWALYPRACIRIPLDAPIRCPPRSWPEPRAKPCPARDGDAERNRGRQLRADQRVEHLPRGHPPAVGGPWTERAVSRLQQRRPRRCRERPGGGGGVDDPAALREAPALTSTDRSSRRVEHEHAPVRAGHEHLALGERDSDGGRDALEQPGPRHLVRDGIQLEQRAVGGAQGVQPSSWAASP